MKWGKKSEKNLNADYIMDLPEEERLEILRLMIKDVDVDDRKHDGRKFAGRFIWQRA